MSAVPIVTARHSQAELRVAVFGETIEATLLGALHDEPWTLIVCRTPAELLETVVERPPHVIVAGLAGKDAELALLHLVRRAAPRTPLILVVGDDDLGVQRMLRELRPYYYDVVPFDPDALRDAVGSAGTRKHLESPTITRRL